MPRRIIGMHDDEPACARRDGPLQRMKIDLPPVVVQERIADQADVLYVRQKIEQWIAGRWNQEFVARIAKRSKHVGIRFAGACGENNVLSRNVVVPRSIIARDRAAGGRPPPPAWVLRKSPPPSPPPHTTRTILFSSPHPAGWARLKHSTVFPPPRHSQALDPPTPLR